MNTTSPVRILILSFLVLCGALLGGCVVEPSPSAEPADGVVDLASIASEPDEAYFDADDYDAELADDTAASVTRPSLRCGGQVCPRSATSCCNRRCAALREDQHCVPDGDPDPLYE